MLTYKLLSPEEYSRIPAAATQNYAIPQEMTRVVAAEDDTGNIVAIWGILLCVTHLEPLWIRKDYRKHPRLIKRLWAKVRETMLGLGSNAGIALVMDEDGVAPHRVAEWCGAKKLNTTVYFWQAGE